MNVSILSEEPALFALIRAGNLRAVSMYMEQFPSNRALPKHGDTTALMLCVESMYDAAGSWHQQAVQGQHNVQQGDQEIEDRVRLLTRVAQCSSYFCDRNSRGQTVLHLAAAAGCQGAEVASSILAVVSEAVLECLLPEDSYEDGDEEEEEENAIVSKAFWIRCHNKLTALHTAVIHQNYKAATLLLKHMVKNKARDYRDYCVLTEDLVPQTLLSLALENRASRKFLRLILQKFPEAASISDVYDKLPLATAIEQRLSSRKLQIILQAYPDATRIANRHGDLPLHLAAMCYRRQPVELQCQILQLLLELHPRAIFASNIHGQWPLHCVMEPAARDNDDFDDDAASTESLPTTLDLAVVQLLSNHRAGGVDHNENTAAHPPRMEQTQSNGMVNDSEDSFNHLAIDYSTESSLDDSSFALSLDKTTALREESEDDNLPNRGRMASCSALCHADCYGELPLHIASRRIDRISSEALQWLLDMYPEAARTVNEYGHLPLHLAAATTETTKNLTNLRTLVEAYPDALWQADYEGDVPLQCAVGNLNVPSGVLACLLIEPALAINDGNHPTANPSTGQLPLHCACASGTANKYLEQLLAYHPAALFHYDDKGYLPFHVAVSNPRSQVQTVKKLLFAAARLLTTRASGLTRMPTTETLPCTADGTPALFVACESAVTLDSASGQATESLDTIRFLVERSPELFNPFQFAESLVSCKQSK